MYTLGAWTTPATVGDRRSTIKALRSRIFFGRHVVAWDRAALASDEHEDGLPGNSRRPN